MKVEIKNSQIRGKIIAPPSKSYAIRLILCAFLYGRKTTIKNVSTCEDVKKAVDCVKSLGAAVYCRGCDITIDSGALKSGVTLDVGDSAALYRMLVAVTAALGVNARFSLGETLKNRDNSRYIDLMNAHGAGIDGGEVKGKLIGGEYVVDVTGTSQFLSGCMIALPLIGGASVRPAGKTVSASYVAMTIEVLSKFGIEIGNSDGLYFANAPSEIKSGLDLTVNGDWSAAANMLSLGALCGKVTVEGLTSDAQGDKAIVDRLKDFGARVTTEGDSVTAESGEKKAFTADCADCPDIVPVLAALAANARGKSLLKNVARLNGKESRRVDNIMKSLAAVGAECDFDGQNITITGGKTHGANFDNVNDHRIVMMNALLAASAEGRSVISGAECVTKSYPEFFEEFKNLCGAIDVEV